MGLEGYAREREKERKNGKIKKEEKKLADLSFFYVGCEKADQMGSFKAGKNVNCFFPFSDFLPAIFWRINLFSNSQSFPTDTRTIASIHLNGPQMKLCLFT